MCTMAINLARAHLCEISSDQVFSDHHQVTNLIADCQLERSRGFLVEYYIRPPITITVNFTKHNIDLKYLELGLKLRQHHSSGIEVYVVNQRGETSTDQQIVRCHRKSDILAIVNGCYRPNSLLPASHKEFDQPFFISSRNIKFCYNIKSIKIKIFSTLNSSVPCLSFLNIFGKPCNLTKEHLADLLQEPSLSTTYRSTPKESVEERNPARLEHLAPFEFIDAITNELMSLPYLLPSGKNVDKSTLDKYTENTLGPSVDPFTRIVFSDSYKPILNLELKTRIDQFKLTGGQSEIDRQNEFQQKLRLSLMK